MGLSEGRKGEMARGGREGESGGRKGEGEGERGEGVESEKMAGNLKVYKKGREI